MDKINRIKQHLDRARHLCEQLNELAVSFIELHDEPPGSDEADELMHAIFDGEDYANVMERVIALKKHRS